MTGTFLQILEGLCFCKSKAQKQATMDLGGALLLILSAFSMRFYFSFSITFLTMSKLSHRLQSECM